MIGCGLPTRGRGLDPRVPLQLTQPLPSEKCLQTCRFQWQKLAGSGMSAFGLSSRKADADINLLLRPIPNQARGSANSGSPAKASARCCTRAIVRNGPRQKSRTDAFRYQIAASAASRDMRAFARSWRRRFSVIAVAIANAIGSSIRPR